MPTDREELGSLYLAARTRLVLQLAAVTGEVGSAEDLVDEAFRAGVEPVAAGAGLCRSGGVGSGGGVQPGAGPVATAASAGSVADAIARPSWVEEPSVEHLDVLAALARLPQIQREAVVAHHLLDLPVDEIAEQLGVPIGTVKARLSRGRKALADLLGSGTDQ